jgi:DNA-binding LytR/AlgR family response regulator
MKINININELFSETEITINAGGLTETVEKIIAAVRMLDMKLSGVKDGQKYILDAAKIVYIESVDKRIFLYTEAECFETSLKLYELEQLLQGDLMRAGKSCLFNFNYIKSLKNELDGRTILTMENNIKIVVSRQYTPEVKQKLEDNCG